MADDRILHKRSGISGEIPQPEALEFGELAINYADNLLFTKLLDGTVDVVNSAVASNNTIYVSVQGDDKNSGSADYDLEKNDDSEKHVSKWTFGVHNVDNGWGYLPDKSMHCRNFKNFETCCILQKEGGRDLTLPYTKFEVLSESGVITTSREYKWIHVAAGSLELDSLTYSQKQTTYNVPVDSHLNLAEKSICIAAYSE
jgi:hypothetical protein